MVVLLDDSAIRSRLDAAQAVAWMGEAVDAAEHGDLVAPPRLAADLGAGGLVFTTGRLRGSWYGYRSYDTLATHEDEQVVVVHDEGTGRVRAVAIGTELGPRRTGALGAVAADALAAPDADVVALIGAGRQAYAQIWALAAVRPIREVRVYSRDPARRRAFLQRIAGLVAGSCREAPSAAAAAEGAPIVILATSSATPVLAASQVAPGAFVSTLGPKQRGRAEFGIDLAERATVLATDSLAQIRAYDPPNVLVGSSAEGRLVSLGAVRARPVRARDGIALFFSVGLAGTEAYLLDRLSRTLDSSGQ